MSCALLSVSRSHLTDAEYDWQIICNYGWTKLEETCCRIESGEITIVELESINAKKEEMGKLCITAASLVMKKGKKDGRAKHTATASFGIPSYDSIGTCLGTRLKEFDYFCNYREQLSNFLQLTAELRLTGT